MSLSLDMTTQSQTSILTPVSTLRRISGASAVAVPCTYHSGVEPHLRCLVDDADVELSPLEDRVVGAQTRGRHNRLTDRMETNVS